MEAIRIKLRQLDKALEAAFNRSESQLATEEVGSGDHAYKIVYCRVCRAAKEDVNHAAVLYTLWAKRCHTSAVSKPRLRLSPDSMCGRCGCA
jgi:hypothetical protein